MIDYTKSYDSAYNKTYDAGLKNYMLGIYKYIAFALAITGVAAYASISTPLMHLFYNTVGSQIVGITGFGTLMNFVPIAIAFYFMWGFGSMSLNKARVLFWVYAATMGIALSYLGLIYTATSIVRTFFICSIAFGCMSIYGYTTKKDLTSMASFLIMGLIGVLVVSLINIFLQSPALFFVTSIIGVVAFMGLIAWNTQKIKVVYYSAGAGVVGQKYALMSAFQLYLDFINLFLYMLRFFGDRRNN